MADTVHEPVLMNEVLQMLALNDEKKSMVVVDATLGGGGHAEAILRQSPHAFLIGMDRDPRAVRRVSERLNDLRERVFLTETNFGELSELLHSLPESVARRLSRSKKGEPLVDRILVDLGISSDQLDDSSRGFSFRNDGPLDMRMNPTEGDSAADLLNSASQQELERIFLRGGVSQPLPRRLAAAILRARPITTTFQLAELCRREAPRDRENPSKDQATVPFQALRIAVNDEQRSIERFLPQAFSALAPGGRLVAISFHSLEDRAVARAMRAWARKDEVAARLPVKGEISGRGRMLTPQAIVPTAEEIARNPRARSARLRAFAKSEESEVSL